MNNQQVAQQPDKKQEHAMHKEQKTMERQNRKMQKKLSKQQKHDGVAEKIDVDNAGVITGLF